jgi:hypothetical protein
MGDISAKQNKYANCNASAISFMDQAINNDSISSQEIFTDDHCPAGCDTDHIFVDACHPGKPVEQLFEFAAHAA